jgi:hypothetical protein
MKTPKKPVMKFNLVSKIFLSHKLKPRQWLTASILLAITLLNLQLRRGIPTLGGTNTPHDDLLGVLLAENIMAGEWLGEWNNLTLAKPPAYSLYLALAKQIPTQLVVVNQLIVCCISLVLVTILCNIFLSNSKSKDVYVVISYAVIIFNPYLFSIEMSRPYRTSLHTILLLLYGTLFLGLLNEIRKFDYLSRKRIINQWRMRVWVGGLATTYVVLILLRSESFWILIPSILVIGSTIAQKYVNLQRRNRTQYLSMNLSFIIVGCIVYVLFISLFGQLNNTKYGTSLVENYYSGGFANAIKDWQRVENGKDQRPYVIVSRLQRQAVYEISPNAAKLKPWLEIQPGEGWQFYPCNSPIKLCDNSGGWFTWQVRDAAISTGVVNNEREFQDFFQQISTDIKLACQRKEIICGASSLGVGVKSLNDLPIGKIFEYATQNALSALKLNFESKGEVATPDQYGASDHIVETFHKIVNYRSEASTLVSGLSYSETLRIIQKGYIPLQVLLICLSILGYIKARKEEDRVLTYGALIFGLLGIILVSFGVSLAQVSFGWRTEGPYLLPIQPLLQIIILVGVLSLASSKVNQTNANSK